MEEELLKKIKIENVNGYNAINLRPNQVGMFNNFMMVAIEEAKKEVFDDIDKFFEDEDISAWENYDEWVKIYEKHLGKPKGR